MIVPCSVGTVRGHGTAALKIDLFSVEVVCDCGDRLVFSWIMESCGIRAWSFCNRIIIAKSFNLSDGSDPVSFVKYSACNSVSPLEV